jgi:hypothetical protein
VRQANRAGCTTASRGAIRRRDRVGAQPLVGEDHRLARPAPDCAIAVASGFASTGAFSPRPFRRLGTWHSTAD